MLTDALLITRKDLKIEFASKVVTSQILPFSLLILILFGIGITDDQQVINYDLDGKVFERGVLLQISPGLYWVAIVFSSMFALSRSFSLEAANGNLNALRMAGLDPSAIFLGKAFATMIGLFLLQIPIGATALIIYGGKVIDYDILIATVIAATVAIASTGTLYAGMTAGVRSKDTLLPLLLLPTMAPVLLAAARSTESALFFEDQTDWGWTMLLAVFAVLYTGVGMLVFESLLEES